jgi:hypothetical protein
MSVKYTASIPNHHASSHLIFHVARRRVPKCACTSVTTHAHRIFGLWTAWRASCSRHAIVWPRVQPDFTLYFGMYELSFVLSVYMQQGW